MLIYAIGDIHGQLHLLDKLLAKIEADAARWHAKRRLLVFLGDYVDRGPDSAGVIERLISGLPVGFEAHFLMGNHEAILLDFFDNPETFELWLMNGAGATLASYGVDAPGSDEPLAAFTACRDRFKQALPTAHRTFLDGLQLTVSYGDYVFVHAGIRPGIALADQMRDDLLWIRDDFLDSEDDFGAVVVHGHTPVPEPEVRPNRIGIDTGVWIYGRLTALRLFADERDFLMAEDRTH